MSICQAYILLNKGVADKLLFELSIKSLLTLKGVSTE